MGALFWRSAITLCALPNHNAGIQSGESLRPSLGLYRDHTMRKILLLTAAVLFPTPPSRPVPPIPSRR